MQIYGIDLASEKFDVSFIDEDGRARHIVVKNTFAQIEKFLDKLPAEAHIVAEHTGVYGDLLLYLADSRGVAVSYVQAYAIKHSMGLVRGKSDPLDCARIREYGERNTDRLVPTHFPSESLYRLKELTPPGDCWWTCASSPLPASGATGCALCIPPWPRVPRPRQSKSSTPESTRLKKRCSASSTRTRHSRRPRK